MTTETESLTIQVGIYRREPDAHWLARELESGVGALLGQFSEEPRYFSHTDIRGVIKVELQRTYEYEFILGALLAGSALFLKGTLDEMGKRFAGQLVDWMRNLD